MKRVLFLQQAYRKMKNAVTAADNLCEVGGVLLGYKLLGHYLAVAATIPENTHGQTMTSFTLDGEYHAREAESLSERFWFSPKVIGVWHSHICDGTVFSEQDKISNKQFSQIYNGILSILVTMRNKDFTWASYHIESDGTSHLCKTTVER